MIFSLQKNVLQNFEQVIIYSSDGEEKKVITAKVDTGADRSSIDKDLAQELGLLEKANIVEIKEYKSGLGVQKRPIVHLKYKIKNKTIDTQVSVVDRSHLKCQMLIGVRDMNGFLVNPDRN